jgi:site-specific DNA-methyltransferase (adenine-specific)
MYLGDCLEVLPDLPAVGAVITDPVWPNVPAGMLKGSEDPLKLFTDMWTGLQVLPARAVVVLGFDSDPRFLMSVPASLPFIRSQQLPYAFPGYRGRLLAGDEMAYVFGSIPKGRGVIPGRAPAKTVPKASTANGHPSPRQEVHMRALVGWWSLQDETVLDPFAGSGTTGVACMHLGRRFVGVEIEPQFFDTACQRIEDAQRQERMFA